MVTISACPVCKSQSLSAFRTCEDFTVSHETFPVVQCNTCTLAITSPRPDSENLGAYYQSDEYISHSGKSSGGIGMIYKAARSFSLNWKAKMLKNHSTRGYALDFGCGTGEFLQTLKKAGWKIEGLEPSETAREKAESITQQKIHTSLHHIPTNGFDAITAWHVMEHVPELNDTIAKLKGLLKKDGTIFIAVPNYESKDAQQYKNFWAGYDVPRHLWHFSKKSMLQLMNAHDLQVTRIIPMKLDSFYVSMLSEKYKGGNSAAVNLMKGFLAGLRSNLVASGNNHSSLIYIIKQR